MLSSTIPTSVGLLTGLQFLSFTTNQFVAPIPGTLANLTGLFYLCVSRAGWLGSL